MMCPITPLRSTRRGAEDDDLGVLGVVVEMANQGPLLLEAEGQSTSYEAAMKRCSELAGKRGVVRVAVVRLTIENGNELILHDMKRMQR